ncbi:aromatic-ring-hydroxylating dioxygenase subunit beta [Paraburkholderia fungorum]|uniref:aromatic-ring-hydroxylating dioxygenase subunit beta n=1 Tax=Paraburkholderia fungorum TaxID=134537 RepID=UPI0038BA8F68
MSQHLLPEITQFLYAEALALDERRWDDWLALYREDCEYWVPAWKSEDEQTSNPRRELSLIYYAHRAGLEDRVWRVKSGRSVASAVLPRTQHLIANPRIVEADGTVEGETGDPGVQTLHVACEWTTHQYQPKDHSVEIFFGRYRQTLVRDGATWRIARKRIVLLNDYLPARIDFYSL